MFASAAVVGLEQVQYSVNEEDGVIEVCAVVSSPDIDCPVDFSFKVKFFTADVTAGNNDKYYHIYVCAFILSRLPRLHSNRK